MLHAAAGGSTCPTAISVRVWFRRRLSSASLPGVASGAALGLEQLLAGVRRRELEVRAPDCGSPADSAGRPACRSVPAPVSLGPGQLLLGERLAHLRRRGSTSAAPGPPGRPAIPTWPRAAPPARWNVVMPWHSAQCLAVKACLPRAGVAGLFEVARRDEVGEQVGRRFRASARPLRCPASSSPPTCRARGSTSGWPSRRGCSRGRCAAPGRARACRPCPLTLWHWTHCSVWNNCSPRRASPGMILGRQRAPRRPARPRQSLEASTLLVSYLVSLEPGHEHVRPEALIQVELLAESVPLPLGVPVYVFLERKGKPRQRLVVARGPAAGGDEQRAAGGQLGAVAGDRAASRRRRRSRCARCRGTIEIAGVRNGRSQVVDVGAQVERSYSAMTRDPFAAVGRPVDATANCRGSGNRSGCPARGSGCSAPGNWPGGSATWWPGSAPAPAPCGSCSGWCGNRRCRWTTLRSPGCSESFCQGRIVAPGQRYVALQLARGQRSGLARACPPAPWRRPRRNGSRRAG